MKLPANPAGGGGRASAAAGRLRPPTCSPLPSLPGRRDADADFWSAEGRGGNPPHLVVVPAAAPCREAPRMRDPFDAPANMSHGVAASPLRLALTETIPAKCGFDRTAVAGAVAVAAERREIGGVGHDSNGGVKIVHAHQARSARGQRRLEQALEGGGRPLRRLRGTGAPGASGNAHTFHAGCSCSARLR